MMMIFFFANNQPVSISESDVLIGGLHVAVAHSLTLSL